MVNVKGHKRSNSPGNGGRRKWCPCIVPTRGRQDLDMPRWHVNLTAYQAVLAVTQRVFHNSVARLVRVIGVQQLAAQQLGGWLDTVFLIMLKPSDDSLFVRNGGRKPRSLPKPYVAEDGGDVLTELNLHGSVLKLRPGSLPFKPDMTRCCPESAGAKESDWTKVEPLRRGSHPSPPIALSI